MRTSNVISFLGNREISDFYHLRWLFHLISRTYSIALLPKMTSDDEDNIHVYEDEPTEQSFEEDLEIVEYLSPS